MPHDAPIAKLLGQNSEGQKWSIKQEIAKLVSTSRDARECFCGEDGELTPAAERIFAKLAKAAELNKIGFEPDARRSDYQKGMQDCVRLLAGMVKLDTQRLEELQRRVGDR
ncbi:hypothetical protein M9978_08325 [Sphingomonas sp. MG17]|uniref:Uncharacterized protein n=1 Tax=Sphingomonas tagetis TaxID=2949092 RepID=A0A9X2HGM2_9SPHN|nr:hypothetical protein [Sphingomonas tagetis]MCP3730433.1 hypothetical protein [Sphingomonas tagetis]